MAKLLSILLQRSDPGFPWGFTVHGGLQEPVVIDQVKHGTLAAQYLVPGDTILRIENTDTRLMGPGEVETLITDPKKSLDLLILKGNGSTRHGSSDSGTGSATWHGPDLKARKNEYWRKVGAEKPEVCREGFTRLGGGANSPFKARSRYDEWRRGHSEERTTKLDDNYSSLLSDGEERSMNLSDSRYSSRIHSVWSPTPAPRSRTPISDVWSREGKTRKNEERQGDVTFWDMSSDSQYSEPRSFRSVSLNREFKRDNSDYSHGYSSLSSDCASRSTCTPDSTFDCNRSDDSFLKKPSDFWGDHYRDPQGRLRFGNSTPSMKNVDAWKNSNLSKTSEFKKSVSIREKSYSSAEGAKSFETYEHVNKTKETEKSSKTVDGGKEKMVEKTKKNKEYIFANKDDTNGQPKETKKIINDFKSIERVMMDGENEFCNKIKERSEDVSNSSTPVDFYDNVRQQGVVGGQKAEWCDHSVNRNPDVGVVGSGSRNEKNTFDDSLRCYSPFADKDSGQKRWMCSTPIPEDSTEDLVYQQEKPLLENYFEVDIRSPMEMQVIFPLSKNTVRRQSSHISGGGGGSPIPVSPQGDAQVAPPPPPPPAFPAAPPPPPAFPPAPPPPPPPGLSGSMPSVRLSTEIPDKRRSAYEPPAAIQNAMMTKDKKPFTYTPGGLDLSEIRSPRMARRINRNANTPDMAPCQPRPSPLSNQPLPPSAVAAMQPQIAIPVLPQGGAAQLHHVTPGGQSGPPPPPPPPHKNQPSSPPTPQTPPSPQKVQPQPSSPQSIVNRQPSPPPMSEPKIQPQHRHTKSEPQTTPGSIYVPPIESQQTRPQLGTLYIPPLVPQEPGKPQSPVSQLNKAPTPWMSRPPPVQKEVPTWAHKENTQTPNPQSQQQLGQPQTRIIPIQIEGKEQTQPNTRIIPIQIEGAPSPPVQPNYQQQQQQQYQQQQQQYHQQQQQQYQQQQSYEQPSQGRQTPRWLNQQPIYVHNKFNSGTQSPVQSEQNHGESQPNWRHSQSNGTMQLSGPMQSPGPMQPPGTMQMPCPMQPPGTMLLSGPVQSRSFKVLEKLTGTDNDGVDQSDAPYNSQGVPLSQLRKLQLSDDDRALMNKVRSQVDDETYLHNESDPRYRGSAIPSRAFRMLQTMTDTTGEDSDVPRGYSPVQGQNRPAANRTPQPDAPQQYVPPSEQQVQEPRKYTGGAIPSRSFRMLQAMTAGSEPSDRPGESEY